MALTELTKVSQSSHKASDETIQAKKLAIAAQQEAHTKHQEPLEPFSNQVLPIPQLILIWGF